MSEPNWKKISIDRRLRDRLVKRTKILDAIRAFFKERGFLEVETPIVVRHPGMEPYLDPFKTTVRDERGGLHQAHLITSPEYSLKKLLAAGFAKLFEITKTFRNGEPWGGGHNPEFTMIEWYQASADYNALMKDTEELVAYCAEAVHGTTKVTYKGGVIDLAAPWERLTTAEAFLKYAKVDLGRAIEDEAWFRHEAEKMGYTVTKADAFDDIFFKIFLSAIEPRLGQEKPVFLCDYPASMAALSLIKANDPRYAERVEAYIKGVELCNGYSELNDPVEQRRRLEEEQVRRRAMGKDVFAIDEQFIEAVGKMPGSAGIALGVDRLVMLLTDSSSIEDVLFFPTKDLF